MVGDAHPTILKVPLSKGDLGG